MKRPVVSKLVSGVSFSFFDEDEVKKQSVIKLVSTAKFDSLQQPLPGGLYDPAMGSTERDQKYVIFV
jgi:DNA-directed RNA polymerase I subunit RPA1